MLHSLRIGKHPHRASYCLAATGPWLQCYRVAGVLQSDFTRYMLGVLQTDLPATPTVLSLLLWSAWLWTYCTASLYCFVRISLSRELFPQWCPHSEQHRHQVYTRTTRWLRRQGDPRGDFLLPMLCCLTRLSKGEHDFHLWLCNTAYKTHDKSLHEPHTRLQSGFCSTVLVSKQCMVLCKFYWSLLDCSGIYVRHMVSKYYMGLYKPPKGVTGCYINLKRLEGRVKL